MSDSTEYQLRRQSEAAKGLLAGLREIGAADDPELAADTVQGETDLLEAIDAALVEMDETEVLIVGLKAKEQQFADRRRAMEERVARFRALMEQAMAICETDKLKRPSATLSLRKTPPALIVDSEAEIPSDFWTPQPPPAPKLDKDRLKAALKEGSPIPGARLSNGGFSLTVRRS